MGEKTKEQGECACTTKTWIWALLVVFIVLFVASLVMAICGWYLYMQKNDDNVKQDEILTAISDLQNVDAEAEETTPVVAQKTYYQNEDFGLKVNFLPIGSLYRAVESVSANDDIRASVNFQYPSKNDAYSVDGYTQLWELRVYTNEGWNVYTNSDDYKNKASVPEMLELGSNSKWTFVYVGLEVGAPDDVPQTVKDNIVNMAKGIVITEPTE